MIKEIWIEVSVMEDKDPEKVKEDMDKALREAGFDVQSIEVTAIT
jgi:hypothetical protein